MNLRRLVEDIAHHLGPNCGDPEHAEFVNENRFQNGIVGHDLLGPKGPFTFYKEWWAAGLPTVEIDEKYAAALILTEPPDHYIPWPWDCCMIHLPELLWGDTTLGQGKILKLALLGRRHLVSANTPSGLTGVRDLLLIGFEGSAHYWTSHTLYLDDSSFTLYKDMQSPRHNQIRQMTRFLSNVRCALSDASAVRPIGKGHQQVVSRVISVHTPKTAVFRLGKPITLDLRSAAKDYLLTGKARRSLVSSQWIVRGHWTHQAHGPERSFRRLQWIEPYWKGPNDAPINFRSHKLTKS